MDNPSARRSRPPITVARGDMAGAAMAITTMKRASAQNHTEHRAVKISVAQAPWAEYMHRVHNLWYSVRSVCERVGCWRSLSVREAQTCTGCFDTGHYAGSCCWC